MANREARRLQPNKPILNRNDSTVNPNMKTKLATFAIASFLASVICMAQDKAPVDDWKSASSNQPGKEYPKVNSEGRVKFRIVAPEAKSVGCTFRESSEFTKGEDGAWYGHTRPLDEGFHVRVHFVSFRFRIGLLG